MSIISVNYKHNLGIIYSQVKSRCILGRKMLIANRKLNDVNRKNATRQRKDRHIHN